MPCEHCHGTGVVTCEYCDGIGCHVCDMKGEEWCPAHRYNDEDGWELEGEEVWDG